MIFFYQVTSLQIIDNFSLVALVQRRSSLSVRPTSPISFHFLSQIRMNLCLPNWFMKAGRANGGESRLASALLLKIQSGRTSNEQHGGKIPGLSRLLRYASKFRGDASKKGRKLKRLAKGNRWILCFAEAGQSPGRVENGRMKRGRDSRWKWRGKPTKREWISQT